MAYKFIIPQVNPLKFYHQSDVFNTGAFTQATYGTFDPNLNNRSIDADFFARNIASWADKVQYCQPYQQGDRLVLMWLGEDTGPTGPYHIRFINCKGELVKTVAASYDALLPTGYRIWYCKIPLWDVPEGKYFIQILCSGFLTVKDFFVISEPIEIKETHPGTMLSRYKNSYNDQGIFYEIDAIEFEYRMHARLTELNPSSKFNVYEDQPLNLQLLSGVPFREWKLAIGTESKPIPDYQMDKIERMLLSDTLELDGTLYTRTEGSKLEPGRTEKHPLSTVEITVREKDNDQDVQVDELYPINFGPVPDTEWFYLKNIVSTFPATIPVARQFHGGKNLIAYLNTVFFATYYDRDNYFSLNERNEVILTTNDPTVHLLFSNWTYTWNYLSAYVDFDIDTMSAAGDLVISSTGNQTAVDYAFFETELDTVPTTGSSTAISITQAYAIGKQLTARIFVGANCEVMDTSGSDPIIKVLGGIIPAACISFNAANNVINRVRNDMFAQTTGSLLTSFSLTDNKLTTGAVDRLIMWLWEHTTAFDLGSCAVDLDSQTPAAPPTTTDPGLASMLSFVNAAGMGVTTD